MILKTPSKLWEIINQPSFIIYQLSYSYILIYLMFNPHIGEMSLSSPVVNTWHKLSIQLSPHPSWWVVQSTGVFQADPRTGPASFRRRGSDLGHFKGSNILGQCCLCILYVYPMCMYVYIYIYIIILYYIIFKYIYIYIYIYMLR